MALTRTLRHRRRTEAPFEFRWEPLRDVQDHDRLPVGSHRMPDWSLLVIDKHEEVSIPSSAARSSHDGTSNHDCHAGRARRTARDRAERKCSSAQRGYYLVRCTTTASVSMLAVRAEPIWPG